MNPHISSKTQILEIILHFEGVTAKELQQKLQISQPTLFKHLKSLLSENKIEKIGQPPKVFYRPKITILEKKLHHINTNFVSSNAKFSKHITNLDENSISKIENNYLYISPEGKFYEGLEGFRIWCKKQNLEITKTAIEYLQTLQKYDQFKQNGLIRADFKLQESFGSQIYLDNLFYLDFYAIERFGKTKLAQLSFQAKQSQDIRILQKIISLVETPIKDFLIRYKIDAVGYIPPTVDRKIQFQKELEKRLNLPVPHLKLVKLVLDTPVQQKTLKSKNDRILNASGTIFVDETRSFSNILLIDDFVGSGATLNITSKKIRSKIIVKNIYGLALTGSFKGFEVINQV